MSRIVSKGKHAVKRSLRLLQGPFYKVYVESKTKHLQFDVRELFFQQNVTHSYESLPHNYGGFNRLDMIVRYLAVENFYAKNDYGFDYYRKMQAARINAEYAEKAVNVFRNLIKSYDEGGYNPESEIEIDASLNLIDGSHRMALAMYHNQPTISCKVRPFTMDIKYGIDWFIANGFSMDEISIIVDKCKQLLMGGGTLMRTLSTCGEIFRRDRELHQLAVAC